MSVESILATTASQPIETFRLTEQDRALILSQVNSTDSLHTAGESSFYSAQQKLEALKKKEVSLQLHATTLAEYIKANRIPRGLRTTLTPNLLSDDLSYTREWYGLCNAFSLDLMYLTIKHLNERLIGLQKEITEVEDEIKLQVTAEKYVEIETNINEGLGKLKEGILKVKKRKFERDSRDYHNDQVYTWNKKKRGQRANARSPTASSRAVQRSVEGEVLTSDSDSSSNGDRRHRRSFLGRGNQARESPERRIPPTQQQRTQQRPVTRAWSTRGRGRGNNRR